MNTSSPQSVAGFGEFDSSSQGVVASSSDRLVSTIGRPSLEDWIRHHGACSDADLHHVVASLAAGCLALQRATGRSHGNLKAAHVVVAGPLTRSLARSTLRLSCQRAPTSRPADQTELDDMHAIGEILVQLVEGRMVGVTGPRARPMRMGECWRSLGARTDSWFLLCHQLIDPELSLANTNLRSLAAEFPLRRSHSTIQVMAIASCAIALLSVGLYLAQSAKAQPGMPEYRQVSLPVHDAAPVHDTLASSIAATVVPTPPATSVFSNANNSPASIPSRGFVSISILGKPGSLASITDADGVFTSLGLVDALGRLTRDILIPAGDYEFTLEHRSHTTVRKQVALVPGVAATFSPKQAPMPGFLRIASTPAGAEVRVNGVSVGTTPLALDQQPAHQELFIEARLPGHAAASRSLTLEPREIQAVDFTLSATAPAPARAKKNRPVAQTATPNMVTSLESTPLPSPTAGPRPAARRAPRPAAPATIDDTIATAVSANKGDFTPKAAPVEVSTSPEVPYTGPAPRQPWAVPDVAIEMQWIGPGEFIMGSPLTEPGRGDNEGFQTAVRLNSGFWMGRFEVTQAQFHAVMDENPSAFRDAGPTAPVEQVSWEEAVAFCRRLTGIERKAGRLPAGFAYTLPTEEQWEYACRAGTSTPWPGSPEIMAWFDKNSRRQTHAPGERLPVADPFGTSDSGPARFVPQLKPQQPNNWGLFDMIGNVAEWCRSAHESHEVAPTAVVRGGGWKASLYELRSARREALPAETRRSDVGFRVVLTEER